jgi:hypothetical protein
MPFKEDLALVESAPKGSTTQIQGYGKLWFKYVWADISSGTTTGDRDVVSASISGMLGEHGMRVSRGWQQYDPTVRAGRPKKYVTLCASLAGESDGGVASAKALVKWMEGTTDLSTLTGPAQEIAVITHFAEVGRGYISTLPEMYQMVQAIAGAGSKAAAVSAWNDFPNHYAPALTYAQDSARDYVPPGEGKKQDK